MNSCHPVRIGTLLLLQRVRNKSSHCQISRVLRSDWELFSQLLVASRKRDLDLKNVLSYELSPVPLSISTLSGNIRKTAKSNLLAELEIDTNSVKALPDYSNSSAYIIDFMAILQTAKKGKLAMFSDLSEALNEQVLSAFKFGNIVSVVPDRYDIELSIKSECKRRSKTQVAERKIISGETKLPSNM